MASQSKNLLLNLIVNAVDQAAPVLTNIKTALDNMQGSAKAAGQAATNAGKNIENGLRQAATVADNLKKRLDSVAQSMAGLGATLAGAGAAMTLPLGVAVKSAADFESEMNKVKAFVNFSEDAKVAEKQFQQLTETAKGFSQFAPTGVAQAIAEIGKAGQDTEQIIASLTPTLNLAFVENRDMRQTAEDLVSIMTAMQLGADQTTRAADVLAKTSAATTTSMGGLTEGMKYAAPIASKLGMSLELTSAFLGVFAQNGFKGEMGGAGFRRVMEDLVKPTSEARATLAEMNVEIAKTPSGQIDAVKTFERLRDAQMSAAQASSIFGTQGMGMALAATKDLEAIKQLNRGNQDATGELQKMVDKINAGLNPALQRLQIAVTKAGMEFAGPFLASLKGVVDGLSGAINWVTEFGKAHPVLTKIAAGLAGAFALIVTAVGGVVLALAGVAFAAGQLRVGWQLLLGFGSRIIGFFTEKVSGIRQETQALNENTAAVQRNAQARQQGQAKGQQGFVMGPTGSPLPAQKGSGVGTAGIATGVASGLITGQMDLGPTENAIGKVAELGGMMAGFGPVAGTIIAGISSWVKVLTKDLWDLLDVWGVLDNKKPADAFNTRVDATLKDMDRQITEGQSFVNNVETAIGRAVSDFGGSINEFADQWKEQFGEELPKAIRDGFAKAQDELKASSGFAFDNIFAESAKGYNTLSGKLGAMKETLDTLNKATEAFYATIKATDEIQLGNLKNEVTALYDSEALRATKLADLEAQGSSRRIAITQQEYNAKKARREQEYAAATAEIERQLVVEKDNAAKREEILKARTDLEKGYKEQSLAAEKTLQDSIVNELKKQQDVVKSLLEARKQLEQSIRDESLESQKITLSTAQKSMSETDRLKTSYAQAVEELSAANALLPTMPEKASEMAKKARSDLQGLTQDIGALKKDLETTFRDNQELLREMSKKTMSPAQAWLSDLDQVKKLLNEAQTLMGQGKFKEAADIAAKAKSEAAKLDKAPEGTNFSQEQLTATAMDWVRQAAELQESAKKAGIEFSVGMNQGIKDNIAKAGITIKTAQEALLDANTKQLAVHGGQLATLSQQFAGLISALGGEAAQGIGGQQAGEAGGVGSVTVGTDLVSAVQQGVSAGIAQTSSSGQGAGADIGGATGLPAGVSTLTRAEQAAMSYTDILLAQADKALADSRAESNLMSARDAGLKRFEQEAARLDRGTTESMDASFIARLNTFLESMNAVPLRLQQYAGGALDQLTGKQDAPGQTLNAGAESIKKTLDDSAGKFSQVADLLVQKVEALAVKVDLSVSDKSSEATITRFASQTT